MKRTRAVRAWLIGLSLVAVAIGAGCGGAGAAAARAVGGAARTAPAVRPAVHVPAYRPPVVAPLEPLPRPPVTGNQFRVGNRVDHGVAAGGDGILVHGRVPADAFAPAGTGDDRRKK